MKFHLLVAASALVVGLGMSGAAFAGNYGGGGGGYGGNNDNHNNDPTSATSAAVALSDQDAAVIFNFAKGTDGANGIGAVNGTGLVNIQQNNGANSVLQDQNTLGAILNCSCTSSSSTNVLDVSLAASEQNALVLGNVSIGAENKSRSGSEASAGNFSEGSSSTDKDGPWHTGKDTRSQHASGAFAHSATWASAETAVQSSNSLSSFGGTGLYNISQNNGNNSMLQSANTVAAIVGK